MPKKVSELEKEAILKSFISGKDIKEIAKKYNYSPATITRQLKNLLNKDDYKDIKINNKSNKKVLKQTLDVNYENNKIEKVVEKVNLSEEIFEVIPILDGLDLDNQKELTSEPIIDAKLPDVVYLIVDKKIELIPKLLKDYPGWSYMPEEDLERVTLEIFADQRHAKKCCAKNEKPLKIPDSNVFIMASKFLKSRGISRIIFDNLLLSL